MLDRAKQSHVEAADRRKLHGESCGVRRRNSAAPVLLPGLQPVEDLDRAHAAFEKVGKDLGVIGKLVTA